MTFKVQHEGQELGPLTLAELREAMGTGALCSMDWCWNPSDFIGIFTVQHILDQAREASVQEKRERLDARQEPKRPAVRTVEDRHEAEEWEAAVRAELDAYKKRLEQELVEERDLLEKARRDFLAQQTRFYEERSKAEAEEAHAREDLNRSRELVSEERRQLAERNQRHSCMVSEFETRRRQVQSEQARQKQRLEHDGVQLEESERALAREKASFEETRLGTLSKLNREQDHLREERLRLKEDVERLSSDREQLDERRERLSEQAAQARKRIAEERATLAEERAVLAKAEKRLASEREAFEETRRRETARLADERQYLEAERRRLAENSAWAHAPADDSSGPKDERHYGRVLGLSGKVSFEEIRKAYRFAAFRCHPDKVQGLHPDFVALATGKLRELNEAFDYFRTRYEKKRS